MTPSAGLTSKPDPSSRFTARLSAEDEIHWLALRMTPGLGTKTAVYLIRRLRTPQAVFQASREELEAQGVPPSIASSIASGCAFEEAVTQQERLAASGGALIPITDPRYPERLREIYDPPPMLFARGRAELLDAIGLGIVGTRRPTPYGNAAANRLARDLAEAGLVVISGMARGIDTAAHKAALEVEGDTIAVFGCGIDELYPAENRKLAERIGAEGLIVSDFPMGAPPYPQNFPIRNRIVSGLSVGVLVVEGGEYSGSAITAKLAGQQGREVFAVPGNITSRMSWGPNLLIKQGAKLVQEWNDVVVELRPEDRRRLVDRRRKQLYLQEDVAEPQDSSAAAAAALGEAARILYSVLQLDAARSLDELVESHPTLSASEIIAALFELELSGLIRQLPGKNFIKVWQD